MQCNEDGKWLLLGNSGEMKTYYISINVRNELDKNIDLKIRFSNGTDKSMTVESLGSLTVDHVMQSTIQPGDVDLYAVESGTVDQIVLLNNSPELNVTPTTTKNTLVVVAQGDSGMHDCFVFDI